MRGFRYCLIIFLSGIIFIQVAQPVHAAEFSVGDAASLISAINTANSNGEDDVITLTADITLTAVNNVTDGENGLPSILFDGNLDIRGNGFTIRRDSIAPFFRIFHMSPNASLFLHDLTLADGYSIYTGGAIFNNGGFLTADYTSMIDNRASFTGGAIDNNGGDVYLFNSQILNNTANAAGGGIHSTGYMALDNTIVSGNMTLGYGGGIYSDGGEFHIGNSAITQNDSNGAGGGIAIFNSGVQGDFIYNSTVSGNTAFLFGGGLFVDSASPVTVTDTTISGNSADNGGGIFNETGQLRLFNDTLSGNQADNGGGIYNNSQMTLGNSTISGNEANIEGGGIYNESVAYIDLFHLTISDNSAIPLSAGGIFNAGSVDLTNSIVANSLPGNNYNEAPGGTLNVFGVNIGDDLSIPGYNLNPMLAPLADNGGSTRTHALLPGSPAIDNARFMGVLPDQRGTARGVDGDGQFDYPETGDYDIGAYEYNGTVPQVSFSVDNITLIEEDTTIATVSVTVTDYGAPHLSGYPLSTYFNAFDPFYSGDYIVGGNTFFDFTSDGTQSFTITVVDDGILEGIETLLLELRISGSADIVLPDTQLITILDSNIATPVPPVTPAGTDDAQSSEIQAFDPAISKIGFLMPGDIGVTGEQVEWVVTVSNTGNVAGNNVTVTDTLIDALRVDSVSAPGANVSINGQTVNVTYPTLSAGQTVQFSIFTIVLDGVEVNNTACVNADNQSTEECATGSVIASLPQTGESPFWRNALILLAGFVFLFIIPIVRQKQHERS